MFQLFHTTKTSIACYFAIGFRVNTWTSSILINAENRVYAENVSAFRTLTFRDFPFAKVRNDFHTTCGTRFVISSFRHFDNSFHHIVN